MDVIVFEQTFKLISINRIGFKWQSLLLRLEIVTISEQSIKVKFDKVIECYDRDYSIYFLCLYNNKIHSLISV